VDQSLGALLLWPLKMNPIVIFRIHEGHSRCFGCLEVVELDKLRVVIPAELNSGLPLLQQVVYRYCEDCLCLQGPDREVSSASTPPFNININY
jgi:hypothetical protein